MTVTKKPKLLQWIGRRAGISNVRIEELWHEAERIAATQTGSRSDAAYFRAAVEQLYELAGKEKGADTRRLVAPCYH